MKKRLGDLRHHLKTRGYNYKVIESGFSKASAIDRNEYKSVVMLPSLAVVVVSRKDILAFDTSCVYFIDGWILLACSKNSSSSW
jgi:hypothetical protein